MQHRVYLDDWSLLEKICLISAVQRFGENWTSICEYIKPKLQEDRQWDWFTAETCEAQYKQLHNEHVKSINSDTPLQQIVRSLKSRCKIEGQPLEEQRNKYLTLKKIAEAIAKSEIGDDQLDKYYERAQQGKKDREENRRKHQELLKKRDIMKNEFEKGDVKKSPNKIETKADGSSPITTSPLLSSLLNNPPAIQYRPTLSTSSFVQTKVTSNQSSTSTRQSTLFDHSSSTVRRLSFQDTPTSSTPEFSQLPQTKDNVTPKDSTPAIETLIKNDSQNLENLVLISPNEEYLSEVDIPPETLLEVIDNLKEGTISLDKIIRDLEGSGDEGIIINKDDLNGVVDESYAVVDNDIKSIRNVEPECQQVTVTNEEVLDVQPISNEETAQTPDFSVDAQHKPTEGPVIIASEVLSETTVSSAQNVQCEISASELENVSESVENMEPAVTVVSDFGEKDATALSNVSVPESVDVAEGKLAHGDYNANNNSAAENEIPLENTRLSSDNHIPCENAVSEVAKIDDIIAVDENQPTDTPKPEEIVEAVPSEEVHEEQPLEDVESSTSVTEFAQQQTAVVSPSTDRIAEVSSHPIADVTEKVEVEEVGVIVVDKGDGVTVNQQSNNDIAKEVQLVQDEQPKLVESSRRRSSVSVQNQSKTEVEEAQPLEKVAEKMTSPALSHPLRQIDVMTPVLTHVISTCEKELVDVDKTDETTNTSLNRLIRRPIRKRKSISEGNEVPLKITKQLPDVNEETQPPLESLDKELNITIKDLRDGIDPSLETVLLKPKNEPIDRESTSEITPSIEKSERQSRISEIKRVAKVRRSSTRTQSPAVKTESTLSSSPNPSDDSEQVRTRRKSILLAYSRLMSHKYSNAFQKPITNKQAPGYENVIYSPMDLQTIKRKIDNRLISTVAEFQRDVLLMLNNAKMFNQINSQVYNMAVEVEKDTLDHLEVTVQALSEGILRRVEKTNEEKIRKRQSFDNTKKDTKSIKRSKHNFKDDASGYSKKIKSEENEDVEILT